MQRSSTLIDPESLKQRPISQHMDSFQSAPSNLQRRKTLINFDEEIPGAPRGQNLTVNHNANQNMSSSRSVFGVDTLWAEACALEERAGGAAQAKSVLSRGLKECRNSGLLWSMAIWAEPRPSRKARSADAIRACGNDPLLLCTVARLLWAERKIEKAREWFKRAISEAASKDMDVGDVWGWWLKFEREHGTTVRVYTYFLPCFHIPGRLCERGIANSELGFWNYRNIKRKLSNDALLLHRAIRLCGNPSQKTRRMWGRTRNKF